MTWEELTWEIITWWVSSWNVNMFWSPDAIWNAIDFYKWLVVWILPLLKTIAYWIVWILIVFFLLLFVFNYMSAKGRKKIQSKDKLLKLNEEKQWPIQQSQ